MTGMEHYIRRDKKTRDTLGRSSDQISERFSFDSRAVQHTPKNDKTEQTEQRDNVFSLPCL
jgi:hypothetical protein